MQLKISFYSYFKDLAGCAVYTETLPEGGTLGDLLDRIVARFPALATMQKSTMMAVGVEYQDRNYVLKANDEVALFPPVQGG